MRKRFSYPDGKTPLRNEEIDHGVVQNIDCGWSLLANSRRARSLVSFQGQINEGYASWESLIGGGAAIAIGLLFVIAGDIGKRTISIEQCLKELRNN